MKKFEHIYVKVRDENAAEVFLNLPGLRSPKLLGHLYRKEKLFRSIPKDSANVFKIYNGLGINLEILEKLNFDFIEIPFENRILRTTREHFLQHSICSPYKDNLTDPQRILNIENFIIPDEKVCTLFEEVV